jgi:hypothetical protein
MTLPWLSARQTFEVPCSIEIEHSPRSLHAHVEIDREIEIQPGDQVLIQDAPARIPYGKRILLRRTATIIRAGFLERMCTRARANFELTELFDVSFTDRRTL